MNSGHRQTDVIVMDFAKAFDKVPHKRLLYKLDFYGIRGSRVLLSYAVMSKKVQVGKDQEKAQSGKDSHSKNRGGKKPN